MQCFGTGNDLSVLSLKVVLCQLVGLKPAVDIHIFQKIKSDVFKEKSVIATKQGYLCSSEEEPAQFMI